MIETGHEFDDLSEKDKGMMTINKDPNPIPSEFDKKTLNKIQKICDEESFSQFENFFPEYLKYINEKNKNIERPLVHGTGSFALKKIIERGLVPQEIKEIMSGEKTKIAYGEKEVIPLSFCDGNDPNGEKVSHYYANQAGIKKDLSVDSERILGERRIDRLLNEVYGGWKKAVKDTVEKFEKIRKQKEIDETGTYVDLTEEELKITREEAEKIIKFNYENVAKEGAYLFDAKESQEKIEEAKHLLNGELSAEQVEATLRKLNILDSELEYQKTPLHKTKEVVLKIMNNIALENSYTRNKIIDIIKNLENAIKRYELLEPKEKEELANQFPCYITIEGEGLNCATGEGIKDVTEEVRCYDNVDPSRIKTIQVPEKYIPVVNSWLISAELPNVKIIPYEYFEMQEIIEAKSKNEKIL